METNVMMFLDCPAHMDTHGAARCGFPAEIQDRYLSRSTDGPLESARIQCPRGHWFNSPVESLTWDKNPPQPPSEKQAATAASALSQPASKPRHT